VQPHSGSQANTAVYFAMLQPGDLILTMDLSHGGHLTHGHKMNFSGRFYRVVHYGVSKDRDDRLRRARGAGEGSAPKDDHGGRIGLLAHHRFPAHAQDRRRVRRAALSSTWRTSRVSSRRACIRRRFRMRISSRRPRTRRCAARAAVSSFCKEKYAKEIDSQVFPGVQGGPLMHVIAAKAVALGEALKPEFKAYQQQVVRNAKALCEGMKKNGFRIVSGTTDNHSCSSTCSRRTSRARKFPTSSTTPASR
jgi:glycine hydroxymethyltransferase